MIRTYPFLLLVLLSGTVAAHDHGSAHGTAPLVQFHANLGQWPQSVLYRANTPGGAVFVEADAFTHVLMSGGPRSVHGKPGVITEPLRMHAYQVQFVGGNARAHHGTKTMGHYVNYFLGNDRSKWAGGVPVHGGVALDEVYPGIDLSVSGALGLKYDWVVHPGADPDAIALRFEGQDELVMEYGILRIRTSAGDVVEQRPVAWQEIHGEQVPVAVFYKMHGDQVQYSFPNGHDPRYRLIIDPVVDFCTYSGSSVDNWGTTATYDETGHLYGAGTVFGIGYPTTLGVLDPSYNGTGTDMGITKFTSNGAALVWSTYYGGDNGEVPHSMVVNSADELYVLGTTGSSNLPTTNGCFDDSFGGGNSPPFTDSFGFGAGSDAVVVHFNAAATALLGATYVGGSANDGLNQSSPLYRNYGDPFRGEIIMDLNDRPVVAMSTASEDLFTTPAAPQEILGGGGLDAYLFRMDPTLSTMLFATFYGGSALDAGLGVQVSSIGEIYLTGGTQSNDILMSGIPYALNSHGGVDGFIARFTEDGGSLLSSTYVGTGSFDQCYFVQLDTDDQVYVVGQTTGTFPVSPGVYANPQASQFIQKFTSDLSASPWSTRIGGSGNENISPSAFLVSVCGQIYFSGWAGSTNPVGGGVTSSSTIGLPVTPDAYQPNTDGSDFYLIVLEPDAAALTYATFFGGSSAEHVDGGTSRFDKDGIVYQAVCAGCSGTFPTTPGAYSSTDMGQNCNLGVFKINFEQGVQAFIDVDATDLLACLDRPFNFTATGNATLYTWDFGDGSAQVQGVTVAHSYAEVGSYEVMLIGSDDGSCNGSDTAFAMVNVVSTSLLEAEFNPVPTADCNGYSVELFNLSTGSTQFIWSFGDGAGTTISDPVHPYSGPGEYIITLGVIDPVCVDTVFTTELILLEPAVLLYEATSPVALCDGESVLVDAGSGFDTYLWSTGDATQLIEVDEPGEYTITVSEGACIGADTVQVVGTPTHPGMSDVFTCSQASSVLAPSFTIQSILWNTGETTPSITVDEAGTYSFAAIDAFGCPVSDVVLVQIAAAGEGVAKIPNVFTPNGDGKNDTFLITGMAIVEFRMEIYDRWGLKMFETTSLTSGWNGGMDNATSNAVPDGTYYYIIDMLDRCATTPGNNHTGHVTLLR